MKNAIKRAGTLILTLAIMCAFPANGHAIAYNGVICMWAGENILPLTEFTMPFVEGDQYYVPSTVFSNELGVTVTNSRTNKTLTLRRGSNAVYFQHETDFVVDENGQFYQNRIYQRNGTWYVPVEFVAKRLNIHCHVYTVFTPTLIYLSENMQYLGGTESEWYILYAQLMADRYIQSKEQKPTPHPPNTELPSAPQDEKKTKYTTYLTFADFPNEHSSEILDILKENDIRATFLVDAARINRDTEHLVRRAEVEGHSLAIQGRGERFFLSPEQTIQTASDALYAILNRRVRLVFPIEQEGVGKLTENIADTIVKMGCRFWSSTITPRSTDADAAFREIKAGIEGEVKPSIICLADAENTPKITKRVIAFFRDDEKSDGAEYMKMSILNKPINSLGDTR